LKPEQWASPLVQEKYQGEKTYAKKNDDDDNEDNVGGCGGGGSGGGDGTLVTIAAQYLRDHILYC
jgi:hypothetical protein